MKPPLIGDEVKYRLGMEPDHGKVEPGAIGVVFGVEEIPGVSGPILMIRVRFGDQETPWEPPGSFELIESSQSDLETPEKS